MHRFFYFLRIRTLQIYRLLKSVGWPYLVLGLPMIGIFLLSLFARSKEGFTLSFLFVLVAMSIHFRRDDRSHLMQLGYNPRIIFVIEYAFVGFVLGLTHFVLLANWQNLLAMSVVSVAIGFIPNITFTKLQQTLFFPVDWLPQPLFEWRSGMRKTGWMIIVIIVLACIFSGYSLIVTLSAIVLISLITTSWYRYFEPMSMFFYKSTSSSLLIGKISQHLLWSSIISVPIYVLFLFQYIDLWYLLLVLVIFGHLINIFAIVYKYACYHPSREKSHSDLAIAIFSISAMIPFFAPVCLVYLFIYTRRAFKNINFLYANC